CDRKVTQEQMTMLGDAMTKFGLKLFQEVKLKREEPNVIVSPLSIALGLSQLALGAENTTETLLLDTLHVRSLNCFHNVLKTVLKELTETATTAVTRIYMKKGFEAKNKFIKESEKFYGTKPATLGGDQGDNMKAINKWVEEKTKGKIKEFLLEIPDNLVLLLLNAIHFKGLWKIKFDPSQTKLDTFYINNETYINTDMMTSSTLPLSIITDENWLAQVGRFSFKGNISLIVIVPYNRKLNASIFQDLNVTDLYNKLPKEKPIFVKLPKFKLDFSLELSKVLSALGLEELFKNPNFGKITDEPIFVSNVQHKSTLELQEDGAEAAAATSITMSRSFVGFHVNSPFFFLLMDDNSGVPLFLGSVTNPNPEAKVLASPKLSETLESQKMKKYGFDPK
uniref:Serpin family F member 2 n=2 Tax=Latimeria chalumnae TaxID=7897 RepID=H3A253_LATCH